LTPFHKQLILAISNVKIKVLNDFIKVDEYSFVKGWFIKPFSIFFSSFEEVILIDADAVFLQNPDLLFSDPDYLLTGCLLYKDRTLENPEGQQDFMTHMLPSISERIRLSRFFNQKTRFEIESGVVVVDKNEFFQSILLACRLNSLQERLFLRSKIYGDKETYWIAMEMLGQVYSVSPHKVGLIGFLKTGDELGVRVCGNLLHIKDNLPMWMNGGLVENKLREIQYIQTFEAWALEGAHNWRGNFDCIINSTVHALESDIKLRLEKLIELYKNISYNIYSRILKTP